MQKEVNWFFEKETPRSSVLVKFGIAVKELLHSEQTEYQHLEIYETEQFGRMLVLDGMVQTTEADEFIYHEMIAHAPAFLHGNPKKALVIGGGDGGTVRELLKHKSIESVVMVEIDRKVVELSKKFIPSISAGSLDNEKVRLIFDDGMKFLKETEEIFDLVVADLSDPTGPAEKLISSEFYGLVRERLRENGVVSVQSGSLTYQHELTAEIRANLADHFKKIYVHHFVVPTYESGEFSVTIATNSESANPDINLLRERLAKSKIGGLKFYSPEQHVASSWLPSYLEDKIAKLRK